MNRKLKWILPALVVVAALPVFIKDPISEKKLNGLETAFEEIYKDRLVVESYIYNLNDALYRSRLLFMSEDFDQAEAFILGQEIGELTEKYAQTKLTDDERAGFLALVKQTDPLRAHLMNGSQLDEPALIAATDRCISSLEKLSQIQLREGRALHAESRKTLAASLLSFRADWISFLLMLVVIVMLLRDRIVRPAKVETVSLN